MKKQLSIIVISIILASCASGNLISISSDELINMTDFSFNSPIGDDWKYSINKEKKSISFIREKQEALGILFGRQQGLTTIYVAGNFTTSNINEENTSDNFFKNEEKIMREHYNKTGFCKPDIEKKDIKITGNKKFYYMQYHLLMCDVGNMLNQMSGEGILYLYFPRDYNKSKVFYLFLIEDYDNGAFTTVELDQIENVLNSFKCNNDI